MLSAMAHGQGEAEEAIGVAFLAAAAGLDEERRTMYGDLVLSSLNGATCRGGPASSDRGWEVHLPLYLSSGWESRTGRRRSAR